MTFQVSVVPPTVMPGNFFPNPTFELGLQSDDPLFGAPSGGWQRGGNSSSINQVLSMNSVSPTHSLALVDNDSANYGEWYLFLNVEGIAAEGDVLDVQWYQMYDTTDGNMRLSFAFLDAGNATLGNWDFNVSGQTPGWGGSLTNSSFERQLQRLVVPAGTTQMRVNFASGGLTSVTGTMLIDDLSVRVSQLQITSIHVDASGVALTWNSLPTRTYTVLFASDLSRTPTWTAVQTGLAPDSVDGLTATYVDTSAQSGAQGYYRIMQE